LTASARLVEPAPAINPPATMLAMTVLIIESTPFFVVTS